MACRLLSLKLSVLSQSVHAFNWKLAIVKHDAFGSRALKCLIIAQDVGELSRASHREVRADALRMACLFRIEIPTQILFCSCFASFLGRSLPAVGWSDWNLCFAQSVSYYSRESRNHLHFMTVGVMELFPGRSLKATPLENSGGLYMLQGSRRTGDAVDKPMSRRSCL